MLNWHCSIVVAYAAVFLGVCGHASSEFVAVLTGLAGPEVSVWRFGLGGLGLVLLALCFPASRDLVTPLRQDGWRLLGIIMLVCVGLAVISAVVDWAVIGPLEGRVF